MINDKPPIEICNLIEVTSSTYYDISEKDSVPTGFKDRRFLTFEIRNSSVDTVIRLVKFETGDFNLLSITYKNYIYQDESMPTMLLILKSLLLNKTYEEKRFLRKNTCVVEVAQKKFYPYEIF